MPPEAIFSRMRKPSISGKCSRSSGFQSSIAGGGCDFVDCALSSIVACAGILPERGGITGERCAGTGDGTGDRTGEGEEDGDPPRLPAGAGAIGPVAATFFAMLRAR